MNSISWRSPSNIALIKYWGKKDEQLPMNPSISFTLSKSYTQTALTYETKKQNGVSLDFLFHGAPKPAFAKRLGIFLNRLVEFIPSLSGIHLHLESSNSFPHSSGIASSASAMSALALCLLEFEEHMNGKPFTREAFYQKASYLARLGSGSAARSVYPAYTLWGKTEGIAASSNLYAIDINSRVHSYFKNFRDAILLISKSQKKVSSSAGHQLMNNHPFAAEKFKASFQNTQQMLNILKTGDAEAFFALVEAEALSLHAMMMTSNPSYLLMEPNTLAIIHKIKEYRHETGQMVCFTLDAGANVHFLYPESEAKFVKPFIQNELLPFCQNQQWIDDKIGAGPIKI
jgi:diphosphomevalonate decarboxylase